MKTKLIDEFLKKIDDIYLLNISLNLAFPLLNDRLKAILKDSEIDKKIHFGVGDPNNPLTKSKVSTTIGESLQRTEPNGQDAQTLTNLCIVSIYQLWEDEFREKIAHVKGITKSELKIDIFGDIRHVRQSIIHNNAKKITSFKHLKIINYLNERDIVIINSEEFDEIIETIKNSLKDIVI